MTPNTWITRLRDAGFKVKALKPLNDGTWDVDLSKEAITNLALLKGSPIHRLNLYGTPVSDLSPLRGMAIRELVLNDTNVSDLSPLLGMLLDHLRLGGTPVTDLSPFAEAKGLTSLTLPPNAKNIEFFRAFPKLERLGFKDNAGNGYLPDKTAAEFWKEYDARKNRLPFAAHFRFAAGPVVRQHSPVKHGRPHPPSCPGRLLPLRPNAIGPAPRTRFCRRLAGARRRFRKMLAGIGPVSRAVE